MVNDETVINLRLTPHHNKNPFYVDTTAINKTLLGGSGRQVQITPTKIINEITVLKITLKNTCNRDYYFPYIQGAGAVTVDLNAEDHTGSIVVTDGMNGCALEVTVENNRFSFYHDQNGTSMGSIRNAGTRICRITSESYWSDQEINATISKYKNKLDRPYPLIQFICVYQKGFWHVLSFGFICDGGSMQEPKYYFEPKGGIYRGYFNNNIRLIQTW